MPQRTNELGTTDSLQGREYENMPFQAGNELSTAAKFEYDVEANKYSLPSLKVTKQFDLVPSVEEAGAMNDQILDAGYDVAPLFFPRTQNSHWYGVTEDEENFYYAIWGNGLFSALFNFGTSSLFICRKKSDASLVWVKSTWIYSLDIPKQQNLTGNQRVNRVALAIYKDRLYTTSLYTNIGPQLAALNKFTGEPIWACAYYPPVSVRVAFGTDFLTSPTYAINSVNGLPFKGSTLAVGDLNLVVAELDGVPSIFVGVSSYQNAVNLSPPGQFPTYVDQGHIFRIDDLGLTAAKIWESNMCARLLVPGDVISSAGPDEFNPFRPGANIVYIFRDTTASGTFTAPGGIDATVLDYMGANPGYIPFGYPTLNNLTTPIIANVAITGGSPPLTELSFPDVFRSALPGIGASPVVFQNDGLFVPKTITDVIADFNAIQALLPIGQSVNGQVFAYIDQATINAVNAAAFGPSNAGVRYVAALPDGYVISNSQEAEALNYYGNSVWGGAPCLDIKRGLIYHGTGQTHGGPLDELLTFQAPQLDYLIRKQPVIDREYEFIRPDSSTIGAPISTLADVNAAKDQFIATQLAISLNTNLKSPRGVGSYCDALMANNVKTGKIEFAFRAEAWDAVTFLSDDPVNQVIQAGYLDGDASSGAMLFEDVQLKGGNYGTMLATATKGTCIINLDISGYNCKIDFNGYNLLDKGIVPYLVYAGPDGILGGSNFQCSQDGRSRIIWADGNNSTSARTKSFTYNTGYYQGFEFHVTRDGRVFFPHDSFIAAYDVGLGEFAWETQMGSLAHSTVTVYNGIAYAMEGATGFFLGYDCGSGELVWKVDGFSKYGMAGINTPSFSQGRGVYICNYILNFQTDPFGAIGNTGLLLDVDVCDLSTPKDRIKSLVGGGVFQSFDVVPRAPGETVFNFLVLNQSVTHTWGCKNTLAAVHTIDGVVYEFEVYPKKFIYSSQEIVFEDFAVGQSLIRYVSLKILTRTTYLLNFQVLDDNGCMQNYTATLSFVACTDVSEEVPSATPKLMNGVMYNKHIYSGESPINL